MAQCFKNRPFTMLACLFLFLAALFGSLSLAGVFAVPPDTSPTPAPVPFPTSQKKSPTFAPTLAPTIVSVGGITIETTEAVAQTAGAAVGGAVGR